MFSFCRLSRLLDQDKRQVFRNYTLSRIKFASLFVVPVSINTIHVTACAILFYPNPEKLAVAEKDLSQYFLEEGQTRVSVSWIGYSVSETVSVGG